MKSEADVYSIDDLERARRTMWDGVRNYQARNNMREMEEGDLVLYYHSRQSPSAVAGVARVVREAYPDPTQFDAASRYFDETSEADDPRWWLVDIEFVQRFDRPVGLPEVKATKALEEMVLVKNSRLSVQPVTENEFECILEIARGRSPG
ncbi:MAG: EVE domain-containing protein [Longimicrobiales bacterium]|nr:EVE domain-containing protein [Longimicrobiales bacterium]